MLEYNFYCGDALILYTLHTYNLHTKTKVINFAMYKYLFWVPKFKIFGPPGRWFKDWHIDILSPSLSHALSLTYGYIRPQYIYNANTFSRAQYKRKQQQ